MAKTIEMIDEYIIQQGEGGEYNPPSYIWKDNKGELIRCKDCEHWSQKSSWCTRFGDTVIWTDPDDYCSRAERKEE